MQIPIACQVAMHTVTAVYTAMAVTDSANLPFFSKCICPQRSTSVPPNASARIPTPPHMARCHCACTHRHSRPLLSLSFAPFFFLCLSLCCVLRSFFFTLLYSSHFPLLPFIFSWRIGLLLPVHFITMDVHSESSSAYYSLGQAGTAVAAAAATLVVPGTQENSLLAVVRNKGLVSLCRGPYNTLQLAALAHEAMRAQQRAATGFLLVQAVAAMRYWHLRMGGTEKQHPCLEENIPAVKQYGQYIHTYTEAYAYIGYSSNWARSNHCYLL
jgi:hypothetical protein